MTVLTDSERRAQQDRKSYMRCACVLTVPTMLVSVIAFVIGAVAINKSAPVYAFPYCIGGSTIAGFFTCVSSFVQYRQYHLFKNNKDTITKEHAQRWYGQLCCLCPCVFTSLILGLVFSGIWGIVKASDEKRETYVNPKDEALAKTNWKYAVASILLVLTLTVLQMFLYCACRGFKNSYRSGDLINIVQGHDEFYIPLNSYTRTPFDRHEMNNHGELRVNYSNRIQPSTTNEQAAGRNVPRLDVRAPYVYSYNQSERNTAQNNSSEQGRSDIFSIPIPELYHGRGREPTAPSSEAAVNGNDVNLGRYYGVYGESPPRYEELTESDLPTYQEVIETGAFHIEQLLYFSSVYATSIV